MRSFVALTLFVLLDSVGLSAAAQPILHEFFEVEGTAIAGGPEPTNGEPIHTAEGAAAPGGNHPDAPGARNAPEPSESDLGLDRDTDREGWLTYYAVFDPTVAPFKRVGVRDRVVLERGEVRLGLSDERPRRLRLTGGDAPEGDESFVGTVLVDFEPEVFVPVPSVSADMVVQRYRAEPTVGVEFFRDGADNLMVRADHQGRVRLEYWVSAPRSYFTGPLPDGVELSDVPEAMRPGVPDSVRATALEAQRLLGLDDEPSLVTRLSVLAQYFRSFRAEPFPPELWTEDAYRDVLFGGRGVCRHRTFAFVVTMQAWGVPARYVYNEAHTFAEVYVPRLGWRRVDLGGGAEGMHVTNAADRPLHALPNDDPLPVPESFAENYSQTVREELAARGGTAGAGGPDRGGDAMSVDATQWDPFGDSPLDLQTLPSHLRVDRDPPPTRQSSVLDVEASAAEVYRGETLALRARLESAAGAPLPGRALRIYLGPPHGVEDGRVLEVSRLETDGSGAASGDIAIPHSLPLGLWGIYVVFAGDEMYAPSRSP